MKFDGPEVAVVIVNWNGKSDTIDCLKSLRDDTYPRKFVVLVDNGSIDDSVSAVRKLYPETLIIETGDNLGFAGGNNVGINRALEIGCDYIFLLNNDTSLEPGAITSLVTSACEVEKLGILTPAIYFYDFPESPWFLGASVNLDRGEAVHDNFNDKGASYLKEIPWASGCAMFMPAPILKELKGFDERFYLNWEDVDLSFRVKAAGWKIFLTSRTKIYHKVGRSFERSSLGEYYRIRNQLLILHLYRAGEILPPLRVVVAQIRKSLRELLRLETTAISRFRAISLGIFDHIAGRYGKCRW